MSEARKYVTVTEDVLLEADRPPSGRLRRVAAAAVVLNPWAGRGFVTDLRPQVRQLASTLACELGARVPAALAGPDHLQAFGKAAIVGLDGEIEHAAALLHTPYFGDVYRELAQGTSIISFADDRAAAGATLTVPMWHKTASATRSHYQTVQVRVADAPRPDEIVVVAAGSSGPRPHARIGDRSTDPVIRINALKRVL